MTTWNIYELMTLLTKCVDRIYTIFYIETRSFTNDTVSSGRYWSK